MAPISTDAIVKDTLATIETLFANEKHPIALHEPLFAGREWEYTKECLDTGWVSSVGKFVDRFESDLAKFLDVGHVVATSNGTAALHICLILAGVKPGDEVIAPTLSFVATANAISYCGATPHLADSEPISLGIDAIKLREYLNENSHLKNGICTNKSTGKPIRALVAMHTFGHASDIDAIALLCSDFKIQFIEDAAESLGTLYRGRHTGNFGRTAALSFNGNKILTTGGGGAVVTNDSKLAKHAKHLTTTAKTVHGWRFYHDEIGFNYRMPNVNAAIGCAQLEELPNFLNRKRNLAKKYEAAFAEKAGAHLFSPPPYSNSNFWLNVLMLDEKNENARDDLLDEAQGRGLMLRPAWVLMHQLPMYKTSPAMDLSQSEKIARRAVCLPSSVNLG